MARKLPWLIDSTSAPSAKAHCERPLKRQRLISPPSISDPEPKLPPPRAEAQVTKASASRTTRTPSTSPPPEPPSQEEMRPGLDADDIYIMVEDEFLAVAQQFTKHLHHAEYQRLKALAKNRDDAMIQNISRPVDEKTAMRTETKQRKAGEARKKKIKEGLGRFSGAGKKTDADDSDSLLEDSEHEPWQGTHLQQFMTKSPKKALNSLTGLQGLSSHTRAAAGYSKPQRRSSPPRKHFNPYQSATGEDATSSKFEDMPSHDLPLDDSEDPDDDDDLDVPARIISHPPPQPALRKPAPSSKALYNTSHNTTTSSNPKDRPPPKKPPQPRSFLDLTPLRRSPPRRPTPPSSLLNTDPSPQHKSYPSARIEFEEPSPPQTNEADIRAKLRARRQERERARFRLGREKKIKEEDGGADAIPVFLV